MNRMNMKDEHREHLIIDYLLQCTCIAKMADGDVDLGATLALVVGSGGEVPHVEFSRLYFCKNPNKLYLHTICKMQASSKKALAGWWKKGNDVIPKKPHVCSIESFLPVEVLKIPPRCAREFHLGGVEKMPCFSGSCQLSFNGHSN